MIRNYIRVIPDLYARKALGQSDGKHDAYPPEAVVAYLGCLCLAEAQTPRGRFRNRKVLEGELEGNGSGERYAAWVQYLIDNGDLIVSDNGSVYVEGWDELQEGDWQVAERMRRWRSRRLPKPEPVPVSDEGDPVAVYWQIIGRWPTDKAREWIDKLIARFGEEATRRAIAAASESGTENLLGRASDALHMAARQAERREREEEQEKVRQQRSGTHPNVLRSRHLFGQHNAAPVAGCPDCQKVKVPA